MQAYNYTGYFAKSLCRCRSMQNVWHGSSGGLMWGSGGRVRLMRCSIKQQAWLMYLYIQGKWKKLHICAEQSWMCDERSEGGCEGVREDTCFHTHLKTVFNMISFHIHNKQSVFSFILSKTSGTLTSLLEKWKWKPINDILPFEECVHKMCIIWQILCILCMCIYTVHI